MTTDPTPTSAAPRPGLRALLAALTQRRLVVALSLAVVVAFALNPLFLTPLVVLLGRMVVIAVLLLLAFAAAGLWHPRWLPRWVAQLLAVCAAAPVATFLVYLPFLQGDVLRLFRSEAVFTGFFLITGTTLFVAPMLALGASYRERDAQARNDALRFELERSTLEKQAVAAELQLMQAQVKPHFLFNTLANVQALVESGSPRAAVVLQHLITYLGAAVPRLDAQAATLGAELSLVRAYLELMHLRMPDRLGFTIDVPPELQAMPFPAMGLLTLVENAVQHGIDPAEQGGTIAVHAQTAADGAVRLSVADTGVGLRPGPAAGMGLANLRARLAAFYRPPAQLELHENRPRGVRAEIVVPVGAGAA